MAGHKPITTYFSFLLQYLPQFKAGWFTGQFISAPNKCGS
jgi:hypothetical protein